MTSPHDPAPQVVYDDEEIRVIASGGTSSFLLVTFGDMLDLARDAHFYADAPARKTGIACLGFMAKRPNWFPAASVANAVAAARPLLDAFEERVTYGGSMGAYAAIKYSKLLGASSVIAYCPQWSIDSQEFGGPTGYDAHFHEPMRGMGIRAGDVQGAVFAFFDPAHLIDTRHLSRIEAAWPQVQRIRVPTSNHHVAVMLAGSQNLGLIVEGVRRRDVPALARLVFLQRRQSPKRKWVLMKRASRRHPRMAAALILNGHLQDIGPEAVDRLTRATADQLLAGGHLAAYHALIDTLNP